MFGYRPRCSRFAFAGGQSEFRETWAFNGIGWTGATAPGDMYQGEKMTETAAGGKVD